MYNKGKYLLILEGSMMSKILVAYASMTGNTELMAEAITDHLLHLGHEAVMKSFDFDPVDVDDISEYDAVIIGTHTWDDGALPYEIEDFYDELEDVHTNLLSHMRSEEHTSELQSRGHLVCRLLLEKKKK